MDLFLEIALPSQLSPRNLPALQERWHYHIYTTCHDADKIANSPPFKRLQKYVKVHLHRVEIDQRANKYASVTHWQLAATREAAACGAKVVFISPDSIAADGACLTLERLSGQSYSAVMLCGVRASLELMRPHIENRFRSSDGSIIARPRALVRAVLKSLHPISKSLLFDAERSSLHPSHIYWRVGKDVLLAHCWHLHPMMIRPHPMEGRERFVSIDDDFIASVVDDSREVYVIQDSDDCLFCEISNEDTIADFPVNGAFNSHYVVAWAEGSTNLMHRHFFEIPIFLHSCLLLNFRKLRIARAAREVVDSILARLREAERRAAEAAAGSDQSNKSA